MTTTQLKERAADLKELTANVAREELTLTKLDFALIGGICLLGGICIGLLLAPFTHGINIGSLNGSYNSNNSSTVCEKKKKKNKKK